MEILLLNLEKGWRGGERQTLYTAVELRARGHRVSLLARANGALALRAKENGLSVRECAGALGLASALLARARSTDIIHAQTAQALSVVALLRPLLRARVVFTRRTAFDSPKARARHQWKWSRADALVAISAAAAAAPRALGLAVSIIPSAVQPQAPATKRLEHWRASLALAGRSVLVTTAALSPEKDPLTLINAVSKLKESHPEALLLHCGADAAAGPAARARIQELRLQNHYRWLDFQPHPEDFMALAQAYVSSAHTEALGSSILDACMAAVPVVACAAAGPAEILDPARYGAQGGAQEPIGILVPTGDAAALASAMAWVLDNPDSAAAMARRAQAAIQKNFGLAEMVSSYEALYERLLAE